VIPGLVVSDHVCFVVPDLRRAVDFFVDVIGARLIFYLGPFGEGCPEGGDAEWMHAQLRMHPESILTAALLRLTDNLGLELYEVSAPDQITDHVRAYDIGAPHLSFRVNDFDAAIAYLRSVDGVVLHGEPQAPQEGALAGLRWQHFETPWGLVLEIDEWAASPYGEGF
jgi:catechol 2,3-dioxygenase-like lactoylglutathione lyase family enzyme